MASILFNDIERNLIGQKNPPPFKLEWIQSTPIELDTVIGSDLPARNAFSIADAGGFSQDEYIKQYLFDPDLSLISKVKIGLRYHITAQPELILQLTVFKGYLEKVNPFLFFEVFGRYRKRNLP